MAAATNKYANVHITLKVFLLFPFLFGSIVGGAVQYSLFRTTKNEWRNTSNSFQDAHHDLVSLAIYGWMKLEWIFSSHALRLSHSVDTVAAATAWVYYKFNRLFTHSVNGLLRTFCALDLRVLWTANACRARLLAFFCSIDGLTTKCLFCNIRVTRCFHQLKRERTVEPLNTFERALVDRSVCGRQADVLCLQRITTCLALHFLFCCNARAPLFSFSFLNWLFADDFFQRCIAKQLD